MKKKILAIFLSLCMAMSLLPVTALATENGTAVTTDTTELKSGSYYVSNNIKLNHSLTISAGATVTLDLRGQTLTLQQLFVNGSLTIYDSQNNGEIKSTITDQNKGAIEVGTAGLLTLQSGTISSPGYGVYVFDGGKTIVNGGKITSFYAPLAGNNTAGDMNFEVNGGTLTASKGPAIYMPGQVSLKITGGTLNGGISLRMGQVDISGGTINAITENIDSITEYYDYSGNAWLADALYVFNGTYTSENESYGNSLNLNITGGTFNCKNSQGSAVAIYDLGKVAQNSQVNISGDAVLNSSVDGRGAYQVLSLADVGVNEPAKGYGKEEYVGKVSTTITGGTFSSDPSKNTNGEATNYLATGYAATLQDGKYVVGLKADDGMEAGGTATGTTSNGTVGGSFANDEATNGEGVSAANKILTIDVTTGTGEGGTPTENTDVTDTAVTIANESLTSVKGADITSVSIATDVGTLTLEKKAWNAITDNANGSPVTLTLKKTAATADAPLTYTLTATDAAGNEVYDVDSARGSIKVDVTYAEDTAFVYYLGADGAEKMNSNVDTEKDRLTWEVAHFSDYAVYSTEQEASVTTAEGKTTCYDTLANAISAANDGDTVTLLKDVTVSDENKGDTNGILTITKKIILDGNGKTITSGQNRDTAKKASVINVENATVTIKDLTINSNNAAKHGLNLYGATVTVENVTIKDGTGYGVVCNSSILNATNLNTSGNGWGGVNVDTKIANKGSSFTMTSGTIGEEASVVIENTKKEEVKAEISGGSFQNVMLQNVKDKVELDITGGNFKNVLEVTKDDNGNLQVKEPTDMITISGGTFKENVSDYLDDGMVQNADGSVGKPYIPPANPNYRIDIPDFEGGTVTADPAAAKAGAKVTLTATPDEGYAVGTITVTDRFGDAVKVTENADGTYTFTMPNGQVTVKATFVETQEPAPAEPFPDVDENDWFYDEVVYVYENGLMNGVENNRFAPNTATNRAMLATILYRLAGEPAVSGDLPFTDVAAGTWYTDAVLWAAQNGIVNGLGENTFAPMNTLTREQLVTMLYRYAEAEGYDVSAAADLSGYPDAGKVQPYAQEAMSWAVAEGIVAGMEDGTLNPAGNATRAQIATILMRFCEGVAK